MILPKFDYFAPESIQEACSLLKEKGAGTSVLAGGTDLLAKMKHGILKPVVLVSLKNIDEMKGIRVGGNGEVIIGARSTHNDLVFSEILQDKYPSISSAARKMAENQIRHLGTVGGNICNAVPSADLPPILMALGGKVRLAGTGGERILPLEDVFLGPGKTVLAQDELLVDITIPNQSLTGSTYNKFGLRRSGALATVGVAVAVKMGGGVIQEVRVALGAVAPVPMLVPEVEALLKGQRPSDELFVEAGKIAAAASRPITDHRASAEYRRHLVGVFTKRGLKTAIEEGHV